MADLTEVYARLREIMWPYAEKLVCLADGAEGLSIETRQVLPNKKNLWFGGVQIKKNYVSYHLMPVYMSARLLAGISPELKKRMQGKSCFNFKTVDEALLAELAELTAASFAFIQQQSPTTTE